MSLRLFRGAAVLLACARHERDYMWCEQKTDAKGQVYFDVADYRYREDGSSFTRDTAPGSFDVEGRSAMIAFGVRLGKAIPASGLAVRR